MAWRSMNSPSVSMPRSFRMVLRTAASTSTARLRPAATCSMTLRTGRPSMSCVMSCSGRRSNLSCAVARTRCTMSFRRIFRRTEVSPKMVRMSSRPRPRTSSRFCSSCGQWPSIMLGAVRENSTASSATRPWPREISSSASSLLPRPDSPVISTPRPSTSRNTPCTVVVGASLPRQMRSRSISCAAATGVDSSGTWCWSHWSTRSCGGVRPSASRMAGTPPISSSSMWCMRRRRSKRV